MSNGYIGFYKGEKKEVMADTKYNAQQKLLAMFQQGSRRKVKEYDIAVEIAERDGKQVTHAPMF